MTTSEESPADPPGERDGHGEGRRSGGRRQAAGRAQAEQASEAEPASPEAELSYEQARDQLTDVVRRLEAGGLTLEQSLELWERGEQLAAICSQWLEGARARLAAVLPEQSGSSPADTPF